MQVVKVIVQIIYVLVCIAMVFVVLRQEGKEGGLSSALTGGGGESYWAKNKGRSIEGQLEKATRYLAVVFIGLSILLNLNIW